MWSRRWPTVFPVMLAILLLWLGLTRLVDSQTQLSSRPPVSVSVASYSPSLGLAALEPCSFSVPAVTIAGMEPNPALAASTVTITDYTGDRMTVSSCPAHPGSWQASSQETPVPLQVRAAIDPTNYGDRHTRDIHGNSVDYPLLVVLHETVGPPLGTIRYFQTPHYRDSEQVSYHALILAEGTIVYLVPLSKRAFGAGNSAFQGVRGLETVRTNPKILASVNNFAYHISLATPADGDHLGSDHSGYTKAQYQSLAWLITRIGVPAARVTTHRAVDRSGERQDPRSFDRQQLLKFLG